LTFTAPSTGARSTDLPFLDPAAAAASAATAGTDLAAVAAVALQLQGSALNDSVTLTSGANFKDVPAAAAASDLQHQQQQQQQQQQLL
jgi:hypothetical protein